MNLPLPGIGGHGMACIAITLLRTDVDAGVLARLAALLSPSERARAGQYRQFADRRRHVVGRAALKVLLAECMGCAPESIDFGAGAQGKPMLASAHGSGAPQFNVSHAGERVAIAIGDVPLGIDLERDAPSDAAAQARAWFTPEEQLRIDPLAPEQAFLDIWTAKEAVLKAAGLGLAVGLHGFSVPPAAPRFAPVISHVQDDRFDGYLVAHFDAAPGYRAAVALRGTARPLRIVFADPVTLLAGSARTVPVAGLVPLPH